MIAVRGTGEKAFLIILIMRRCAVVHPDFGDQVACVVDVLQELLLIEEHLCQAAVGIGKGQGLSVGSHNADESSLSVVHFANARLKGPHKLILFPRDALVAPGQKDVLFFRSFEEGHIGPVS